MALSYQATITTNFATQYLAMADNFKRMLQLVTEFFDVRNDPDQLDVNEEVREKLQQLHPATMTEVANDEGPIMWLLLIPTTHDIMGRFLSEEISERQLFDETQAGITYDAIYLCSAAVLPEFRRHGLAKKACMDAINSIRNDHPINNLFYWPFSEDGKMLAETVAKNAGLPLLLHPAH